MDMTKVDKGRLFEERVLAVLEEFGYDAALTARGADGGVDVLVRMGDGGAPVPVQ